MTERLDYEGEKSVVWREMSTLRPLIIREIPDFLLRDSNGGQYVARFTERDEPFTTEFCLWTGDDFEGIELREGAEFTGWMPIPGTEDEFPELADVALAGVEQGLKGLVWYLCQEGFEVSASGYDDGETGLLFVEVKVKGLANMGAEFTRLHHVADVQLDLNPVNEGAWQPDSRDVSFYTRVLPDEDLCVIGMAGPGLLHRLPLPEGVKAD